MARIKILNDSNTVLIDDTYKNLVLLSKGTNSFTDGGTWYGGNKRAKIFSVPAPINTRSPILAISSNAAWSTRAIWRVGGVINCHIVWHANSTGTTFEWFMFEDIANINTGTGEIILRNAEGLVVFDSDKKYMRVKQVDSAEVEGVIGNQPVGPVVTYNLPANRKYAAAQGVASFYDMIIPLPMPPPNDSTVFICAYWGFAAGQGFASKNRVVWDNFTNRGTYQQSGSSSRYGYGMIIDVTNY